MPRGPRTTPHSITANDVKDCPAVKDAIRDQFLPWLVGSGSDTLMLCAWNGLGCDFDWLFEISEVRHPDTQLLSCIKHHWDPHRTSGKCKPCRWHPSKWGEAEDTEATGVPSAGKACAMLNGGKTSEECGLGREHDAAIDVEMEVMVCTDTSDAAAGKGLWLFRDHNEGMGPWGSLHGSKAAKLQKRQAGTTAPLAAAAPAGDGMSGWTPGGDDAAAAAHPDEQNTCGVGGGRPSRRRQVIHASPCIVSPLFTADAAGQDRRVDQWPRRSARAPGAGAVAQTASAIGLQRAWLRTVPKRRAPAGAARR